MKDFLWIRDDVTGSQWEGIFGVFGGTPAPRGAVQKSFSWSIDVWRKVRIKPGNSQKRNFELFRQLYVTWIHQKYRDSGRARVKC